MVGLINFRTRPTIALIAVGFTAFALTVATLGFRNGVASGETDYAGPGGPTLDHPGLELIATFLGASIDQQNAAVDATVACLRAQGFDAFTVPGEGLRPATHSGRIPQADISRYNAAVGPCLAESNLSAIQLAVADDMEAAPEAAKQAATTYYDQCMAGETSNRVDTYTCTQATWATTGLLPGLP